LLKIDEVGLWRSCEHEHIVPVEQVVTSDDERKWLAEGLPFQLGVQYMEPVISAIAEQLEGGGVLGLKKDFSVGQLRAQLRTQRPKLHIAAHNAGSALLIVIGNLRARRNR
jgi:hypothetical protein